MVSPVTPSPLPEDKVPRLAIACAADVETQSLDGLPVVIAFGAPVVTGGNDPVTSGCAPASGSTFNIGTTNVSCSASDSLQQATTCALSVAILGPPKLSATKFLAFGDSLTAGFVAPPVSIATLESASAYPFRLQLDLAPRYMTQVIQVVNSGNPGEEAVDAIARFRADLATHQPDAVFLMEGTNDLDVVSGSGASAAASGIDSMVLAADAAGVDTFLLTIPPQRGTAAASSVPSFNNRLRAIAQSRGATLVDVFSIVSNGRCSGATSIPCIGNDGLHPTAEAYQLIADALSIVVIERYDVEILPTAVASDPDGWGPSDDGDAEPRATVSLP